jgi:hypothetical protein
MPLDLANIASNKAHVTVPYGGSEVKVTYKPAVITSAMITESDKSDDGTIAFLISAISTWDVLNGKKKVPLNAEALQQLPIQFLRAVMLGILRDRGDEAGEAGSNSNST